MPIWVVDVTGRQSHFADQTDNDTAEGEGEIESN